MSKKQISLRASDLTIRQMAQLQEVWGTSQTETLSLCIDRAHALEFENLRKASEVTITK